MFQYLLSPFSDPDRKRSSHGDSDFSIDGLRGLAMLVVVASHTNAFGMAGQGSIGVLLFFVLSGYVLTMLFVDRPERVLSIAAVRRFAIPASSAPYRLSSPPSSQIAGPSGREAGWR